MPTDSGEGAARLTPRSEAAVDAFFSAGPDASDTPAEAAAVAGLLALLEPVPSPAHHPHRADLIHATLLRASLAGPPRDGASAAVPGSVDGAGRLRPAAGVLAPADGAALDSLVDAQFRADTLPGERGARAARLAALLAHLDEPPHAHGYADVVSHRSARIEGVLRRVAGWARGADGASASEAGLGLASRRWSVDDAAPGTGDDGASIRGGWRVSWPDLAALAAVAAVGASVLLPAMATVRSGGVQAACFGRLGETSRALGAYASDHQGAIPVAASFGGSWIDVGADPARSNSANLYVLVRSHRVDLESLACPGNAHAAVGTPAPEAADWGDIRQVSYSYRVVWGAGSPEWARGPGDVVLADRSPVVLAAVQGTSVYPEANSPNHAAVGQHLVRTDGAVQWSYTPVLPGGDNIWLPRPVEARLHAARAARGLVTGRELPDSPDDVFLAP